jgi:transcriptional regulator with XRE-family HTH domain
VARRAGVSVQYLSEVERGRKEPSSEMIAAIAGAHDLSLHDLTLTVAERLARPASGAVLQAA